MSHLSRDLADAFLLCSLDDRTNVQLGPDLQTCSFHSRCLFDPLSERTVDNAWIGVPAVCQHEQGA